MGTCPFLIQEGHHYIRAPGIGTFNATSSLEMRLWDCATRTTLGAMASEPLGQRIKKERLALVMTQRDLADAVGITVPYMSKIEAGKETPTEEKLVKLAEVLKLNPDELILAAGRMPADVMDRVAADPTKALEFLRKIRK